MKEITRSKQEKTNTKRKMKQKREKKRTHTQKHHTSEDLNCIIQSSLF